MTTSVLDRIYIAKADFIQRWGRVPDEVVLGKVEMDQLCKELAERKIIKENKNPRTVYGIRVVAVETATALHCA